MSLVRVVYNTGRQCFAIGQPYSTPTFLTRDARPACKKERNKIQVCGHNYFTVITVCSYIIWE